MMIDVPLIIHPRTLKSSQPSQPSQIKLDQRGLAGIRRREGDTVREAATEVP
jgi:hypothetical protein